MSWMFFSLSKGSSLGGTQLETSNTQHYHRVRKYNASGLINEFGWFTIISIRGRDTMKSKESFNFLFAYHLPISLCVLSSNHISALKVRFKFFQCAYSSLILQLYCKGNEGVGGRKRTARTGRRRRTRFIKLK